LIRVRSVPSCALATRMTRSHPCRHGRGRTFQANIRLIRCTKRHRESGHLIAYCLHICRYICVPIPVYISCSRPSSLCPCEPNSNTSVLPEPQVLETLKSSSHLSRSTYDNDAKRGPNATEADTICTAAHASYLQHRLTVETIVYSPYRKYREYRPNVNIKPPPHSYRHRPGRVRQEHCR
jgi:hypothetical protein